MYYEPFVGLIPEDHRLYKQKFIEVDELEMDDILLLEDGHCFKESVINLCRTYKSDNKKGFQLESGSFETLVKLSNEGLGMTLLPYIHTLDMTDKQVRHLRKSRVGRKPLQDRHHPHPIHIKLTIQQQTHGWRGYLG